MNEYISREATIDALDCRDEYDDLVNTIREQPAAKSNELILAAFKQLDSDDIFREYLKISECIFRSINDRQADTITIGCERPGVQVEVSITVKDGESND